MLKILSIDDSKAVHAFINNVFAGTESTISHAFNGKEGLQTLDKSGPEKFDLILLDWEMPGITGIETLAEIRKAGIVVPVIMLTSKNLPEDIGLALSTGANEYVMKPFTKDILIEKLESVLGRKI